MKIKIVDIIAVLVLTAYAVLLIVCGIIAVT